MVVGAIVTIVLFALLGLWEVAWSSFASAEAQTRVNQELRKGVEFIVGDVTEAGVDTIAGVPADGVWYPSVTFEKPAGVASGELVWSGTAITYALGGEQLLRTTAGDQRVVANRITSFKVRREAAAPAVLEFLVSSQQTSVNAPTVDGQLHFKVRLRN